MGKFVVLILVFAVMFSITGCVSKSAHDELLNEKTSIEQERNQLAKTCADMEDKIVALQNIQEDVKKLTQENRNLKSENLSLQAEHSRLSQQLQQPVAEISGIQPELS